ncbi:MAG: hypothetical protein H0X63_12850, partial [Flavobacteriales bacterium]|nr:hypothetical protein [Flavobacteriales bacterium]
MKKSTLLLSFLFFTGFLLFAQNMPPETIATGVFLGKTPPVSEMPTAGIPPVRDNTEARIIKNRLRGQRKLDPTGLPLYGETQAQKEFGGIHSYA